MFTREVIDIITDVAERNRIEPAALLAIADVESAGKPFTMINGRPEPLIRFEGHWFDRLVADHKRAQARKAGLASPTLGAVKNPRKQANRYALLERAMTIDRDAAIASTSWGVGQVMGGHWESLGFTSPTALMMHARRSIEGQVDLMVRFLRKNRLLDVLKARDWSGFARRYNGPKYARNRYDVKIKKAYRRYAGKDAPAPANGGMLRVGSIGRDVRALQARLRSLGYAIAVDGDFGPATERAVLAFQSASSLEADGIVGPRTLAALEQATKTITETPGDVPLTSDPDVGKGVGVGGGGAVAVETAKRSIDDALQQTGGGMPDWLFMALTGVSVALALGGLAFIAWQLWDKRRTRTGLGDAL